MKLRNDVTFQDGDAFQRRGREVQHRTREMTIKELKRKAELAPVESVDVIDDFTVRFNLCRPLMPH